jgi:hypothetical protein
VLRKPPAHNIGRGWGCFLLRADQLKNTPRAVCAGTMARGAYLPAAEVTIAIQCFVGVNFERPCILKYACIKRAFATDSKHRTLHLTMQISLAGPAMKSTLDFAIQYLSPTELARTVRYNTTAAKIFSKQIFLRWILTTDAKVCSVSAHTVHWR